MQASEEVFLLSDGGLKEVRRKTQGYVNEHFVGISEAEEWVCKEIERSAYRTIQQKFYCWATNWDRYVDVEKEKPPLKTGENWGPWGASLQ